MGMYQNLAGLPGGWAALTPSGDILQKYPTTGTRYWMVTDTGAEVGTGNPGTGLQLYNYYGIDRRVELFSYSGGTKSSIMCNTSGDVGLFNWPGGSPAYIQIAASGAINLTTPAVQTIRLEAPNGSISFYSNFYYWKRYSDGSLYFIDADTSEQFLKVARIGQQDYRLYIKQGNAWVVK